MAETMYWGIGLEGSDRGATARWLAERVWRDRIPEELVVSYKSTRPKADWIERLSTAGKGMVAAYFTSDRRESLIVYPTGVVAVCFPFERDVLAARRWLEEAPFEVASFDTLYPEWSTIDKRYQPPSFSRNHFPHGWGCAFKGNGHANLVSRRWLEFGPWALIHGENDLSLVQFHDLAASAKVALAQAKPAQKTMGIDDEGGFIQRPYVFETVLKGMYEPTTQTLRVVVLGRELRSVELLDACAARKQGALSKDQPLRQVAYVFPDPAEAKRNVHALWLRELECWTVIDGIEQRLDTDYRPTPKPPAWASTGKGRESSS